MLAFRRQQACRTELCMLLISATGGCMGPCCADRPSLQPLQQQLLQMQELGIAELD